MKKSIVIAMLLMVVGLTANAQSKKVNTVTPLTYKEFLQKVWDFEKNPSTFVYKGDLPAVIDFYADWCGPCRRVSPIMEKLAKEYSGKLLIYKVNVEQEGELASAFQVQSIPMVLFIPVKGQPSMQVGAMAEEDYRAIIEEDLLK